MGGTIQVQSEVGKGTTFRIHLTVPIVPNEKIDKRTEKYSINSGFTLMGRHVLVAEDHPINREIMKRLLEKQGIKVDMAEDGKQCVEMYASKKKGYYAAILMDVRMPVMDGIEATRHIRAMEASDELRIPIIAATANAFSDDRKIAEDAGMTTYIVKPVNPEELYKTLHAVLI